MKTAIKVFFITLACCLISWEDHPDSSHPLDNQNPGAESLECDCSPDRDTNNYYEPSWNFDPERGTGTIPSYNDSKD